MMKQAGRKRKRKKRGRTKPETNENRWKLTKKYEEIDGNE